MQTDAKTQVYKKESYANPSNNSQVETSLPVFFVSPKPLFPNASASDKESITIKDSQVQIAPFHAKGNEDLAQSAIKMETSNLAMNKSTTKRAKQLGEKHLNLNKSESAKSHTSAPVFISVPAVNVDNILLFPMLQQMIRGSTTKRAETTVRAPYYNSQPTFETRVKSNKTFQSTVEKHFNLNKSESAKSYTSTPVVISVPTKTRKSNTTWESRIQPTSSVSRDQTSKKPDIEMNIGTQETHAYPNHVNESHQIQSYSNFNNKTQATKLKLRQILTERLSTSLHPSRIRQTTPMK
ncbi:hypothetical protein Ocin01_19428 [Orchesella cincta]|uniref:Uncharacterized protein n=1 Tax=Orchesella cincta TaxID=48709 RepID=A0A1D2M2T4_ORCCI|nr:hypothetical protein Ocin01_19428 [Orchesella cincta]